MRMFSPFGLVSRIGLIGLVVGLPIGAYAFTASNTVPATKAGDGNNAITGYTISNVHYTVSGANPQNVDSFSFSLDTAPVAGSTVKARIVSTGSFVTCSFSGTAVACPDTGTLSGISVQSLDSLDVVAVQ
jgi:hypothetical protein